jgi:hypothetical protein
MPNSPTRGVPPAHGTGAYFYARRPLPDPDALQVSASYLVENAVLRRACERAIQALLDPEADAVGVVRELREALGEE